MYIEMAQGCTSIPRECLRMENVANNWARFDGVIMIKQPKAGTALPQLEQATVQIVSNS